MEKISKMENNFKNANYWHIIDTYKLFAHYRHLQITEKWQPPTTILR